MLNEPTVEKFKADLRGELIHITGFRFVIDIDPDQQIALVQGQPPLQRLVCENIIDEKHHRRPAAGALRCKDIIQLAEAAAAEYDAFYRFEVAKHGCSLGFSWLSVSPVRALCFRCVAERHRAAIPV